MRNRTGWGLLAAAALAFSSLGALAGAPAARSTDAAAPRAPTLAAMQTEEGQSVVYDAYTWRRRELAKKLPLNEPWPSEFAIAAQFQRFGLDKAPVPEMTPVPSRILRDVYLVNSVPNLAYLIDAGPAGLILVDPGLQSNAEAILKNVEALGFRRDAVKWVVNTHAHFDHSMGRRLFPAAGRQGSRRAGRRRGRREGHPGHGEVRAAARPDRGLSNAQGGLAGGRRRGTAAGRQDPDRHRHARPHARVDLLPAGDRRQVDPLRRRHHPVRRSPGRPGHVLRRRRGLSSLPQEAHPLLRLPRRPHPLGRPAARPRDHRPSTAPTST